MSEDKKYKLLDVAKELNIGLATAADALKRHGMQVEGKPSTKINSAMYEILQKEYHTARDAKKEAEAKQKTTVRPVRVSVPKENETKEQTAAKPAAVKEVPSKTEAPQAEQPKKQEAKPKKEQEKAETKPKESAPVIEKKEDNVLKEQEKETTAPVIGEAETAPKTDDDIIRARSSRLTGPTIIGKIELPVERKIQSSYASNDANKDRAKRKRKPAPTASSKNTESYQNPQGTRPQNAVQGNRPPRPAGQPYDNTNKRPQQPQQYGTGVPRPAGQNPNSNTNKRPYTPQGQGTPGTGGFVKPGFKNQGYAPRKDFKGGDVRSDKREEVDEKAVQEQIKQTLAKLQNASKGSTKLAAGRKHRRQKRDEFALSREEEIMQQELHSKTLKVTEFVTANELAAMMNIPVNKVIATCMALGIFVSINQRLDAETLAFVADEFGFKVEFVSADVQEEIEEEEDSPESLEPRSPIITVMGHVDHGKTSLLDFIRKANVIAGEAGGITQHIGAYEVTLDNGKKITFLDTPGHEAFTAMRARGAKITDIAVIVIAADDAVMPQTVEAINHAQAAGVPIVFAFNKIDREGANPDKIREQLAAMNILVEEWGGKYQTQEISAKKGLNIDLLLEKVLLEAEILDLKANPNRRAVGTVVEAALDKGRGIITTVLIQNGTLHHGDPILAGQYYGKVKAMFNERGQKIMKAAPATPVLVLGMQGAPQAGDKFSVPKSEQEAKDTSTKRMQLLREQGLRTQKHITLDEIGRRLAIGNFKELNIIVKGDVDGSVEALSDSLLKLSTDEIQVKIIHKSVGQISESDVLLASASDAIIIGFQVRPSASARKLAEQEQIDIRMYSVIYKAIEEIKAAMEGMLSPEIEEKVVANVEIRETFKITKVGTIAGCMVLDGKINRNSKIRVIRDGVVIHNGVLDSLKRFKDDVKEVSTGYECGLNIKGFNDILVGDIIEAYEEVEVKRTL